MVSSYWPKKAVLLIMASFFIIATAYAQVPRTMSFQGVLTNPDGTLPDGSQQLTFTLYDAATGGTALWTETQQIDVASGVFNAVLGSVNELDLPFDMAYWLGIALGGGAELEPRIALTASPYSLSDKAQVLEPEPGQDFRIRNAGGETTHLLGADGNATHVGDVQIDGSLAVGDSTGAGGKTLIPPVIGIDAWGSQIGIKGETNGGIGVKGITNGGTAVAGEGRGGIGVAGESVTATGVYGASSSYYGVLGVSDTEIGVNGFSENAAGVYGSSNGGAGVHGYATNDSGVYGEATTFAGVEGYSDDGPGVWGASINGSGIYGQSVNSWAGEFENDVYIQGRLKIDDVPGSQSTRFLVWDADNFVKWRTLPAGAGGDPFVGLLDGLPLIVRGPGGDLINADPTSERFDIDIGLDGLLDILSDGASSLSVTAERIFGGIPALFGDIFRVGDHLLTADPAARSLEVDIGLNGILDILSNGVSSFSVTAERIFGGIPAVFGNLLTIGDSLFRADPTNSSVQVDIGLNGILDILSNGVSSLSVTAERFLSGIPTSITNIFSVGDNNLFRADPTTGNASFNLPGAGILDILSGGLDALRVSAEGIVNSLPLSALAGLSTPRTGGGSININPDDGLSILDDLLNYLFHARAADGAGLFAGFLFKAAGGFRIDHPLNPANQYLNHSFVESPDMMNVYNGNIVLDANGEAWIDMPSYFEALNRDFRYQLTAIGAPGPNLYVAEEIQGNRFKIAGGSGGMKVSWQITGIRQDAFANENRMLVEEDKQIQDRGRYLHPRLYGASAQMGVRSPLPPVVRSNVR